MTLGVAVLLGQMAAVMITTAVQQTPTTDEPVYVGTAAVYLQKHSLQFNPEHPPLGKLIIGAGVAAVHPRLDPGFVGDQWALGHSVLYETGNDPWRLMLAARLPVILLTLLFGLVVFAFAAEVAGALGGLLALSMYAFSPDVIAHGSLATLDVPTAGFLLTACWLAWRARRGAYPVRAAVLAGLALGAALATKMSALPAVPVVLALIGFAVVPARETSAQGETPVPGETPPVGRLDRWRRPALITAGAGLVAVAVVWVSYLLVNPTLRWTQPIGMPDLHGAQALAANLLPFPEPYRDGLRIQFGFADVDFDGFLFGDLYRGSRWYYLPAALLVKMPLGMMALWVAGAVTMLAVRRLRPAAAYLLVPAGVLLAGAMTGTRDFGARYAIAVPIFLAVVTGAVVQARRPWRWLALPLALFVAVSSVRTFPYYLPYANEAFGGPARTYRYLHDSNVDWGQDLGRLADRLRTRYAGERIWLVYKGNGDPAYYGIDASDPLAVPSARVHGIVAISDSWIDKSRPGSRLRQLIDTSRPIDSVGHAITIFRR
ncbi:glycosyl transferase [Mangrovihabitans endophyticus]|uniref:Glycosyl transferase n=1 Tax=Mangrovihabitans endophyticus TaxID=1751298 RepID=A0A8J3FPV4_9ACTN|nr:glycosyl transferase [Mangrovihabitans endophyticus]